MDGGEGGEREGVAINSVLGLNITGGVVANLGRVIEVSGLISGTRPTGTVLRKCVRGIPRASNSGRSGSWRG